MNKQSFLTAVSKSPLLLAILLVPLLCLGWVTQLMAQSEPTAYPDFVITEPLFRDIPAGDSYQIQFVGLLLDENDAPQPIKTLVATPATETIRIQEVDTEIRSLTDDPFYISLVIDTSGSMGLPHTIGMSGTEPITQPSNLDIIKAELSSLVAEAPEDAFFSVVGFNGQISSSSFQSFTRTKEVVQTRIAQLETSDGSTCLNDVAFTAVQSLKQLPQNSRRAIILFTDGVDELTRGQPERCSQEHTFERAVLQAADATPPIPLHIVNYPYNDGVTLTEAIPLTNNNHILTGLSLNETNFMTGFQRIMDSFTHQWLATIELYTPPGTFELKLTPYTTKDDPDDPQIFAYTAVHEHYPAALLDSITLENIEYDEATEQFIINFVLCPDDLGEDQETEPFCQPELTENINVLIEDMFAHETRVATLEKNEFQLTNNRQTIRVKYPLTPEHYYLVRLTAENGLTSANYHPRAEAVFAYQPQLEFTISQPQLTGFDLYPDLTLTMQVNRTQKRDTVPHASVLNGRPFFNNIYTQQPDNLEVSGYLLYTGDDNRQELYPLQPQLIQSVAHSRTIPITFDKAGGGGYADYELFLTVNDNADGIAESLLMPAQPDPDLWYGRSLRQVRQILAEPLGFVVAVLASLLLLGLIWFVVWLARRSVKAKPEEALPVTRISDPVPAKLYVDASPDKQVHHKTFDLPLKQVKKKFLIGRDYECELQVRDDENMADIHACIEKKNGGYFITNCDTEYATYINSNEIISNASIPIHDGDKIRLGHHTRFTFTTPKEAQEINENGHQ